jgi:type III pantothenate kinase
VSASILSTVVSIRKDITGFLQSQQVFILLNSKTKLPVRNRYKTPGTLGSDRIASVAGAAKLFPGKNILVIDAGTCIKYDFITAQKEYLGGSISPGLRMRFQALHNFTDGLPLIQPGKISTLVGTSTKDSVLTGVELGIVNEINGFIADYKKKFGPVKVLLSGGDAALFAGHIKSSIFAAPNLIHTGLLDILKYNVE